MSWLAYQLNHVFALDPPGPVPPPLPPGMTLDQARDGDRAAMAAHRSPGVRKAVGFLTPDRRGYVLRTAAGDACAACIFTPAAKFPRRDIARLRPGEWALAELIVWPEYAGAGLGTLMVMHASRAMFDGGASRLISFMWWSHAASLRVFLKAGWRRTAFAVALGSGRNGLSFRLPPALAPGASKPVRG